jgi:peptidoglycan/LPS O-acetylase OafA/YrhL
MLALLVDRYKTSSLQAKIFYGEVLVAAALMPIYVSDRLRAQKDTISNFTGSFDYDELIIVELLFILIPAVVYFSKFSFAKNKTFTKISFALGAITYPLYLLHWKIGDTIITKYAHTYGKVTLLSSCVALCLIIISYYISLYELRVRKYLKKRFFHSV